MPLGPQTGTPKRYSTRSRSPEYLIGWSRANRPLRGHSQTG